MADHIGIFNVRAREKEDGEFITVDFQRGGTQIVCYTLWASRKALDDIANDPAMAGVRGEAMYKALIRKGAYPSNAWRQEDGSLHPMPYSDKEREGIKIGDIIPCLQKFDKATGERCLVKYSDHLMEEGEEFGLDDPLPGVAAVQETQTIIVDGKRYTATRYLAHYTNGHRHSPKSAVAGEPRKAAEQAYYPLRLNEATGKVEGGGIMWLKHWYHDKNVSVDGQPKFEEFDMAGHPLYLINQQDNVITTEELDTDGNVKMAISVDEKGGRRHLLTPDEIANLPKIVNPSLG